MVGNQVVNLQDALKANVMMVSTSRQPSPDRSGVNEGQLSLQGVFKAV